MTHCLMQLIVICYSPSHSRFMASNYTNPFYSRGYNFGPSNHWYGSIVFLQIKFFLNYSRIFLNYLSILDGDGGWELPESSSCRIPSSLTYSTVYLNCAVWTGRFEEVAVQIVKRSSAYRRKGTHFVGAPALPPRSSSRYRIWRWTTRYSR